MNILLIIALCLIIIYFIVWLFSTSKTLSNYQKSNTPLPILSSKLSNPNSVNYSYSFWIYIDSWENTAKPKAIFYRKASTSSGSNKYYPVVYLGQGDNTLSVSINTEETTNFVCKMTNVPIQTWSHVAIVLNNKVLDMYMNGKLVKTCVSSVLPKAYSDGDITLCPAANTSYTTWDGKIARFTYYGEVLSAQDAWNIYKKGPSGNILSSFLNEYKIKLSFLKGGVEKANITI